MASTCDARSRSRGYAPTLPRLRAREPTGQRRLGAPRSDGYGPPEAQKKSMRGWAGGPGNRQDLSGAC